jgi:hypothetical protein
MVGKILAGCQNSCEALLARVRVTRFRRQLNGVYTETFNKRRGRVEHVLRGRDRFFTRREFVLRRLAQSFAGSALLRIQSLSPFSSSSLCA